MKSPTFRRVNGKPIYRWGLPKRREFGQFADLRGGLGKKEKLMFLRGG